MNSNQLLSFTAAAMHAVNLQPNQLLYIRGGVAHREIALAIESNARARFRSDVIVDLVDPRREALLLEQGDPLLIATSLDYQREHWKRVIKEGGATIALAGVEFPHLRGELQAKFPTSYQLLIDAENASRALYLEHVVNKGAGQWCIVPVPTDGWAHQVYGETPEARDQLTEAILRMMFADRDPESVVRAHEELDAELHRLKDALDALSIRELRVEGPGTDFTIGLRPEARWLAGSKTTSRDIRYNPNRPSFEAFTTPDCRTATGVISMTMPFLCSGVIVENLVLTFEEGRISHVNASAGLEAFNRWIDTDEGARRIGEFALVDRNSPIGLEGVVFYNTLLDENASGHFAIGSSYSNAIEGGTAMTREQLVNLGANQSKIHTDMMWNGPGVTVTATTYSGAVVALMEDGCWAGQFAKR